MKHIRLFENFVSIGRINESEELNDLIFDWMPFDDQINNPINSKVPKEISYGDLLNFSNEGNTELNTVGIYIAHKKMSDGGFVRIITSEISPLIFDVTIFDPEFKKKSENKGVLADKFDLSSFIKGSDIINRYRF